MLSNFDVTNDQGVTLSLSLTNNSLGYSVKDVDGLDPVKATLVSSSVAQRDGSQYQSSRRENRNIIIKLGLEPGYGANGARGLRQTLYGFFMPKSEVHLRFYDDGANPVDIVGRVESFDAPLFVQEPVATISLMSFDPDFFNPTSTIVAGNTVSDTTESLINYAGSVETGVLLKVNVNRTMTGFTIYHRPGNSTLRSLDFTAALSAGDLLAISTVFGAKGATLTRAGINSSLLYGISPYANWINLEPGPNYLRVYAGGAAVPYTLEYTTKFGGL